MGKYLGIFGDKQDIAKEFSIGVKELDGCDILLAYYSYEDYSGEAFVLFEKDGIMYEVNGSHCSCYGLETQWKPEETCHEALMFRMEKGELGVYGSYSNKFREELQHILCHKYIDEMLTEGE